MRVLFVASALIKAAPAIAASSTTFYVDPAGNNANTGLSVGQAWKTSSYALTNAAFTNAMFTTDTTVVWTGGSKFPDTNLNVVLLVSAHHLTLCGSGASPAILTNSYMQGWGNLGGGGTALLWQPNNLLVSNLQFTGALLEVTAQDDNNVYSGGLDLVATNLNFAVYSNVTVANCGFTFQFLGAAAVTGGGAIFSNVVFTNCWGNSNINTTLLTISTTDIDIGTQATTCTNLVSLQILNCQFTNNPAGITADNAFGVFMLNCSNSLVQGCLVSNLGVNSINDGGGGSCGVLLEYGQGNTIRSNEAAFVYMNPDGFDGSGFQNDGGAWGNTWEYNYAHGCDGPGLVDIINKGRNLWRFNISCSNALHNTVQPGEMAIVSSAGNPIQTNLQVYNNTLIARKSGVSALYMDYTLGGSNVFANNILCSSNAYCVSTVDTTHVTFVTNDYTDGGSTAPTFNWNGTTYASFALWTAGTSQDPNGFHVDPGWASGDVAATIYPAQFSSVSKWAVGSGSPLINAARGPYAFNNGGLDWQGTALGSTFNVGPVTQAGELVTWTNPAPATYGAAVSAGQLNAAANVPGSFAYNPPLGAVLNTGTNILSVIFTPTDTVDYNSVTDTVSWVVVRAPLTATANNALRAYGAATRPSPEQSWAWLMATTSPAPTVAAPPPAARRERMPSFRRWWIRATARPITPSAWSTARSPSSRPANW